MSTTKRLIKELKEQSQIYEKYPDYIELMDYYKNLEETGIIVKQIYSIPQIDVTGKSLNKCNCN